MFEVYGQEFSSNLFKNAINGNNLSHAYIIHGPDGVGKSVFAKYMAALIFCKGEGKPCGKCASCIKLYNNNHPDYILLSRDNKSIGVDDIRNIIDEINTRPYEGDKKVVVIKDAENITLQGQNAMLKTLEEPGQSSIIVMLTENINSLIDTIKSRSQILRLGRIPKSTVQKFLEDNNIERDRAILLSELSDGIIGNALKFTDDKYINLRKETINIAIDAAKDKDSIFERVDFFVKNKEDIFEILDLLTTWFRDLMIIKLANDKNLIINRDCYDLLVEESQLLSYNKLNGIIDIINETKNKLRQYSNYQLTIEVMLLNIQEV